MVNEARAKNGGSYFTADVPTERETASLIPRLSPALFLAAYVTFELPARIGSKVTYVAKSGAGDGLGTRL